MSFGLIEILFATLVIALVLAASLILFGFWRATSAPADSDDEPR